MTLDEAIKHEEEEAIEQDKLCKRYDGASGYSRSHNEAIRTTEAKRCKECAKEYRQLAEWLKELKAQRDAWMKVISAIDQHTEIHSDGEFYIKNFDVKKIVAEYKPKGDDTKLEQQPLAAETKYFETIYKISQACGASYSYVEEKLNNATRAIKTLEKLQQQPCGDAISRENTLKAMIEQLGIRNEDYLLPAEATLYKVVKNMPPVTTQPEMGLCSQCCKGIPEKGRKTCPACLDKAREKMRRRRMSSI